MSLQISRFVCN